MAAGVAKGLEAQRQASQTSPAHPPTHPLELLVDHVGSGDVPGNARHHQPPPTSKLQQRGRRPGCRQSAGRAPGKAGKLAGWGAPDKATPSARTQLPPRQPAARRALHQGGKWSGQGQREGLETSGGGRPGAGLWLTPQAPVLSATAAAGAKALCAGRDCVAAELAAAAAPARVKNSSERQKLSSKVATMKTAGQRNVFSWGMRRLRGADERQEEPGRTTLRPCPWCP